MIHAPVHYPPPAPGCHLVCREHRRHWKLGHPWEYRWHHLLLADRVWLRVTANCESHNDPATNTGNGFYGLVQFTLATARAAGFTVRPDRASWHEQAVRAVRWMHVSSKSQWPVCGRH